MFGKWRFYTEVDRVARLSAQIVRPGDCPAGPLGPLGLRPGLDRLHALAVQPSPESGERPRLQVALRRLVSLPQGAADRSADPGAVLPQLLWRLPQGRYPEVCGGPSPLVQAEVLPGQP